MTLWRGLIGGLPLIILWLGGFGFLGLIGFNSERVIFSSINFGDIIQPEYLSFKQIGR
jgi:hypothetical protein